MCWVPTHIRDHLKSSQKPMKQTKWVWEGGNRVENHTVGFTSHSHTSWKESAYSIVVSLSLFSPLPAAHGLQLHKILLNPIFLLNQIFGPKPSAVEGRVQRAMVKIVIHIHVRKTVVCSTGARRFTYWKYMYSMRASRGSSCVIDCCIIIRYDTMLVQICIHWYMYHITNVT